MANAPCAAPLINDDFVLSACDNLISENTPDAGGLNSHPRPNGILTLMPVEPERLGHVGIVEWTGNG